jgi:beta-xylosidase
VRDPSPDPRHGSIDPTIFVDSNGSPYLYWKSDGNAYGAPCHIYAQPLSANGTQLVGQPTSVLTNDQPWEGSVVEAPWVEKHDGFYYLYYSGNCYANASYAVGVARSTSPLGPFTKAPAPILHSNAQFSGPGHMAIVTAPDGQDYMLFHSWLAGHEGDGRPSGPFGSGGARPGRELLVNRVRWENGWPAVNDGTPAATDVGPSPDEGLPLPVKRAPAPHVARSGPFSWIAEIIDDALDAILGAIDGALGVARAAEDPTPGFVGALKRAR